MMKTRKVTSASRRVADWRAHSRIMTPTGRALEFMRFLSYLGVSCFVARAVFGEVTTSQSSSSSPSSSSASSPASDLLVLPVLPAVYTLWDFNFVHAENLFVFIIPTSSSSSEVCSPSSYAPCPSTLIACLIHSLHIPWKVLPLNRPASANAIHCPWRCRVIGCSRKFHWIFYCPCATTQAFEQVNWPQHLESQVGSGPRLSRTGCPADLGCRASCLICTLHHGDSSALLGFGFLAILHLNCIQSFAILCPSPFFSTNLSDNVHSYHNANTHLMTSALHSCCCSFPLPILLHLCFLHLFLLSSSSLPNFPWLFPFNLTLTATALTPIGSSALVTFAPCAAAIVSDFRRLPNLASSKDTISSCWFSNGVNLALLGLRLGRTFSFKYRIFNSSWCCTCFPVFHPASPPSVGYLATRRSIIALA